MSCLSHARIYRKVSLTDCSGFILRGVVSLINNFWYLQKNKGIFHSGTICENLNFGIFDCYVAASTALITYTQFTPPRQTRQNSPVCVVSASAV